MKTHDQEIATAKKAGRADRIKGKTLDQMPARFANANLAVCTAYGDAYKAAHAEITGKPFCWNEYDSWEASHPNLREAVNRKKASPEVKRTLNALAAGVAAARKRQAAAAAI